MSFYVQTSDKLHTTVIKRRFNAYNLSYWYNLQSIIVSTYHDELFSETCQTWDSYFAMLVNFLRTANLSSSSCSPTTQFERGEVFKFFATEKNEAQPSGTSTTVQYYKCCCCFCCCCNKYIWWHPPHPSPSNLQIQQKDKILSWWWRWGSEGLNDADCMAPKNYYTAAFAWRYLIVLEAIIPPKAPQLS